MEELDFEKEGENGERCRRELQHLDFLYVPQINWDITTKVRIKCGFLFGLQTCRMTVITLATIIGQPAIVCYEICMGYS